MDKLTEGNKRLIELNVWLGVLENELENIDDVEAESRLRAMIDHLKKERIRLLETRTDIKNLSGIDNVVPFKRGSNE